MYQLGYFFKAFIIFSRCLAVEWWNVAEGVFPVFVNYTEMLNLVQTVVTDRSEEVGLGIFHVHGIESVPEGAEHIHHDIFGSVVVTQDVGRIVL